MSAPSFLKSLPISSYPRFKCPLSEITLSPSAARPPLEAPPRREDPASPQFPEQEDIFLLLWLYLYGATTSAPKAASRHRRLKPCLIHGLFKPALPASRCLHGEKDRLKIRRKSRVWPVSISTPAGRRSITIPILASVRRPGYPDPGSHFRSAFNVLPEPPDPTPESLQSDARPLRVQQYLQQ